MLRKAPPLHGKKVRPDLHAFTQHCFARWVLVFSFCFTCFYECVACIILIFCHPDDHKGGRISGTQRRENIRLTQVDVHEILRRNAPLDDKMFKGRIRHTTDTSTPTAKRCVSLLKGPLPAFSGEALRNFCSFPLRRKSCLSAASSFSLGKE